jgi:hypothetical protein
MLENPIQFRPDISLRQRRKKPRQERDQWFESAAENRTSFASNVRAAGFINRAGCL